MMKEIPKYVKQTRLAMGFDHVEFGRLLGVHRTTVYKYETGQIKPSLKIYLKIQALEKTFSD